jgi:hypothetical protein
MAFAGALTALAGCAGAPPRLTPIGAPPAAIAAPEPVATPRACGAPAWTAAAAANAASLQTLAWAPFGRSEAGWEAYVPLIQHEIGTACPPASEAFAQALADWQAAQGLARDGVATEAALGAMKAAWQDRRPFVRLAAAGQCPETPDLIAGAEGVDGKAVTLRPAALAAYRRLLAAARAEVPEIAADPELMAIFSGYRSPWVDAARCAAEGNCDGVARARCSAHRTGLAVDLYLGHAEGYMADATAAPNRLHLSRTAAYRWLVANAGRFGFVNYAFEPWHWEWTGEPP